MRLSLKSAPRFALPLALSGVLVLTACGAVRESRLNPFNWFGRSQEAQVDDFGIRRPEDKRQMVDQVLDMVIEPTPQGAIVRATGLTPKQGYYDAELVALPVDDKGVLVYEFRVMPSPFDKPVGAPRTREVTVAAALSVIKLEGISQIVVQGANNARSSRR